MKKKDWVQVKELRDNKVDLSHKEDITVRFRRPWFSNTSPYVPEGMGRDDDKPVMTWGGRLYDRYNASDERSVYEFPSSWLSRLPKTAEVDMTGVWEGMKDRIQEKRLNPQEAMTIQEMRQLSASGNTIADHMKTRVVEEERIEAEVDNRLAEIEAVKAKVAKRLAEIEAVKAARKEELKKQRLANLAKAREAKKQANTNK